MPKTNKPETKTEKRRLRGIEAAQAAILLVMGVAVSMILYVIVSSLALSTPVPVVQVDPYNSMVNGGTAEVTLKFGKTVQFYKVEIISQDGLVLSTCYNDNTKPITVKSGQSYSFTCNGGSWTSSMLVRVTFTDGSVALARWVTPT